MTPIKENIVNIIASSQDGKALKPDDDFSAFMLVRIDHNTDYNTGIVNVETLVEDYNYMINQLQAAVKALEE